MAASELPPPPYDVQSSSYTSCLESLNRDLGLSSPNFSSANENFRRFCLAIDAEFNVAPLLSNPAIGGLGQNSQLPTDVQALRGKIQIALASADAATAKRTATELLVFLRPVNIPLLLSLASKANECESLISGKDAVLFIGPTGRENFLLEHFFFRLFVLFDCLIVLFVCLFVCLFFCLFVSSLSFS